ncbi:fluoride efflux transporter CrcB [Thermaerobacter sp. FW80]|uniref:fluoride efflux transporter CrcB n=1 Tax=Thermaerobacter sp. FW80 TaxID=2546351 RepID=UPI001075260B|nr:fluoride efflux transporter CrcB [Thermaerobacter sp. FW80]QBS38306.1 fluoride efflux transporter CrcB [Thermaerobacter sp. FW80]
MAWIGVALGGAAGAVVRYGLSQLLAQRMGAFPWATLAINVTGSFILAFLHPWLLSTVAAPALRVAITSGFVGAYTTFSTMTWEALVLVREGQPAVAAVYLGASLALGMLAAWMGWAAALALGARS